MIQEDLGDDSLILNHDWKKKKNSRKSSVWSWKHITLEGCHRHIMTCLTLAN